MPLKTGILLINLGTPQAPTAGALRTYLREFLSDPRVVEVPRLLWWLILNGIILNTRPARSARKYARIWTPNGSPLLVCTRQQAALLEQSLGMPVVPAMRYGQPSIGEGIEQLCRSGCERLLVFPLYPQYSAPTTASSFDAVFDALKKQRNIPECCFIRHYPDHPDYIAALAASVRDHQTVHGLPDVLLMSFHGMPEAYRAKGDPYYDDCTRTAQALARALELRDDQWRMTFQSRFGKEEWIKPYTDQTLHELAHQGVGRVDVICPGFSADCLETLEEIALDNRDEFLAAGGQTFHYIPALNTRADGMAALENILRSYLREG